MRGDIPPPDLRRPLSDEQLESLLSWIIHQEDEVRDAKARMQTLEERHRITTTAVEKELSRRCFFVAHGYRWWVCPGQYGALARIPEGESR